MADWSALQQRLPLMDKARLAQLDGELGTDTLHRLLGLFLEDGRLQGEALSRAFADGDFEQMAKSCHSLKSACGSYGALRCQFLAEKLEAGCRQQDAEATGALMVAWELALSETLSEVQAQLEAR
ncbi:Hpt domain-containing protein [Oceanimonas doudoroffii]|uniref:Hpt domain-containing protein n=1 Tax=Oceanimonas doudoroffii TaxID=84158 RepID=A0A233RHE9_9GAMM|nr:Hpt domain-containing protein [Oceanimonas doudoroffii]OXY82815.1 Hpt domain-containing protein [Oceanimonas doudoroffii]